MNKTLNIIRIVITWAAVVIAVCMMGFTIISATTLDRNDRGIFGIKMFKVLSDSMSKTDFSAGDLIFVKETKDPSELKEGDIISYISTNTDNFGEVITHKIRRLTTDANGAPGFVTYGTTTDTDDEIIVTYPYVLGQYVGRIPKAGYFFDFLQTTPGYIVCILLPFSLLILSQALSSVRLYRRYRAEQTAELDAERAKVEAEKAETKRMMEELLAMKAQLEANQMPVTDADADTAGTTAGEPTGETAGTMATPESQPPQEAPAQTVPENTASGEQPPAGENETGIK